MDFQQQQLQFANAIRDPQNVDPPGNIEARRMKIYRDLFFNNIDGFLSNTFPVLKSILGEQHWLPLVRRFFTGHACHSPIFSDIPGEFLNWLQQTPQKLTEDFPFMLELAHYEWVEMAVAIANDKVPPEGVDLNGDLLAGRPVLSPLMYNLSYHFPVHTISPENQPHHAGTEATHLVVYRDRLDRVVFLQINAATQQIIELIRQQPAASGLEILQQISAQMPQVDSNVIISAGHTALLQLREKNILLGTVHLETAA